MRSLLLLSLGAGARADFTCADSWAVVTASCFINATTPAQHYANCAGVGSYANCFASLVNASLECPEQCTSTNTPSLMMVNKWVFDERRAEPVDFSSVAALLSPCDKCSTAQGEADAMCGSLPSVALPADPVAAYCTTSTCSRALQSMRFQCSPTTDEESLAPEPYNKDEVYGRRVPVARAQSAARRAARSPASPIVSRPTAADAHARTLPDVFEADERRCGICGRGGGAWVLRPADERLARVEAGRRARALHQLG